MLTLCAMLVLFGGDPVPNTPAPKSKDPAPKVKDPAPKDSALKTPRKPNPLAPSLPELTEKEDAEIDRVIDRFIKADTGKIGGEEARSAIADFKDLGPEATFGLIRGFNKSAHIDHSCPALTIARKLTTILRSTEDVDLLQYAKENIGAGPKKNKYADTIRDLKMGCNQRITAVKNKPVPNLKEVPM